MVAVTTEMSAEEEVYDDLPVEEEEEEAVEEEEENENDYYASDVETDEGTGAHDATFQIDPEYYEFTCLSTEEAWNFLDSQARDLSEKLKVSSTLGLAAPFHHQDSRESQISQKHCSSETGNGVVYSYRMSCAALVNDTLEGRRVEETNVGCVCTTDIASGST